MGCGFSGSSSQPRRVLPNLLDFSDENEDKIIDNPHLELKEQL